MITPREWFLLKVDNRYNSINTGECCRPPLFSRMKKFKEFISECHFLIEKRGGNPKYSDEHANINLYNHLVSSSEIRELIRKKDYESIDKIISQELQNAKTDPEHPLNFNNISDEGFSGKKKTSEHEDAYYSELERAVPGFSSLVQSKKGASIAANGWVGRVSGGEHEASKPSWKGNVKGQGRFDYVFSDPEDPKKQHRVSGKDYRGSQAGSAQADQATATLERGVEVAAQKQLKALLANKPKKKEGETEQEYKERLVKHKLETREKKKEIVSSSKETLDKIKELMASTKGMDPEGQKDVYTRVQAHIDGLEKTIPGVKLAAGQEMLQGRGQFSKGKTAQSMWTTGGAGASFRDPRQQSVGLRARAGKGGGREMAVAGDIPAAPKEKAAQKERQSSFALFSRRAQQALAAAEQEKASAQRELETNSDGSKTYLQHQAQKRINNPDLDTRLNTADTAIQTAHTTIADIQARAAQAAEKPEPKPQAQQQTQPQRTEPVDTKPTTEPKPVETPKPQEPQQTQQTSKPQEPQQTPENPEEKRKRETRERMNAAGQRLGLQ